VTAAAAPIQMQQMTVEFTLEPLVWSDGTPVTAEDSTFSFQIAADRDTPVSKQAAARTASYTALDAQTVQWIGLPGHLAPDFLDNFWQPLPRHQLGEYSAAELREAPETNRTPLSSGPFVVESWEESEMRLARNPHYYRPQQPILDEIIVRFGVDAEELLAADFADCDVVTQDALDFSLIPELAALDEAGSVVLHVAPNAVFEHVDFGINSWGDYGDGALLGRPDWFEEARARQAITMCTNRAGMVEEIFYGRSQVMPAYVPPDHPLLPDDLARWPYDPAAGNALLDEVGFLDTDGDGIREAPEPDPISGELIPFRVTLTTEWENPVRRQLTEMMQADLAECGIAVELEYLPPEEWYADGPLGPLFGRRFDLGAFAWVGGVRPPCHLWLSDNAPGPETEGFGGWGDVNVSGWQNDAFDAACRAATNALPGTEAYAANHQSALRRFAQELPAMPLFSYVNVNVVNPELSGFQPDPTEPSSLWNIYAWDMPR
jgi:peptide/nickel transport system substrate-binding protein